MRGSSWAGRAAVAAGGGALVVTIGLSVAGVTPADAQVGSSTVPATSTPPTTPAPTTTVAPTTTAPPTTAAPATTRPAPRSTTTAEPAESTTSTATPTLPAPSTQPPPATIAPASGGPDGDMNAGLAVLSGTGLVTGFGLLALQWRLTRPDRAGWTL